MKSKKKETAAIRDQLDRTQYREHSTPLFLTSSFTFDSAEQMASMFAGDLQGDIYSRYANPNTGEFISKMCHLEGANAGFATASGMAAVWASVAGLLDAGDHLMVSKAVFGSTHQILTTILPRFGIHFTYVDPVDMAHWEQALTTRTKMLLLETPSNPALQLVDLKSAAAFANAHQLILNVDNCFATPIIQNPMMFGAHLVTHSGTKYIDGQGRVLGGIILGDTELLEKITFFCRHTGPAMSPFNAWLLSKSLETLAVRMERHCHNALALASYLEDHPATDRVVYPHLPSHPQFELATSQMWLGGGVVTFEISGGSEAGTQFLDRLKMCSLTANLGDSRTIVTHPASTTHSKLSDEERASVGITNGMIRISVGLEHVDDIKEDLNQALAP